MIEKFMSFISHVFKRNIKLKIKKLSKDAVIPTKGTEQSACYDLYITKGLTVLNNGQSVDLSTGLAVEIPNGYVMKIMIRSGLAFKHDLILVNGTGIIDADYRKEVKIKIMNLGTKQYLFNKHDRVAQFLIDKVLPIDIEEVEELSETERNGGFGSTGK